MNVTGHGRSENLGRGAGLTPRVDMPWARRRGAEPKTKPPAATDCRNRRRFNVMLKVGYVPLSLRRRLTLRLAHVSEHPRPDRPLGLYGFFVRFLVCGELLLRFRLAAQAAVGERQLIVGVRVLGLKPHGILQGRHSLLSAAGRDKRFAQTDEGLGKLWL